MNTDKKINDTGNMSAPVDSWVPLNGDSNTFKNDNFYIMCGILEIYAQKKTKNNKKQKQANKKHNTL
jgi:hypothetical protein